MSAICEPLLLEEDRPSGQAEAALAGLALRPARDRRNHDSRKCLLRRVRAEFDEMPCLQLTLAQAQRLFGLRADICERVLNELVAAGHLRHRGDGRYTCDRIPA